MERRIEEFQMHHRNTFNIVFHIGCGLVYMSLLLSLLPSWFFWVYFFIVLGLFPSLSVGLALGVLWVGTHYVRSLRLPWTWTIVGIGIVFMLPEVSHWIAQEPTVLKIENLTLVDLIDNFFFLYPQSVLAQTRQSIASP